MGAQQGGLAAAGLLRQTGRARIVVTAQEQSLARGELVVAQGQLPTAARGLQADVGREVVVGIEAAAKDGLACIFLHGESVAQLPFVVVAQPEGVCPAPAEIAGGGAVGIGAIAAAAVEGEVEAVVNLGPPLGEHGAPRGGSLALRGRGGRGQPEGVGAHKE